MSDSLKADIDAIQKALEAGPTPGPWRWWTSWSFRRLSSDATGKDGDVLSAVVQRFDGHPDIHARAEDRGFIEACDPTRLTRILSALSSATARADKAVELLRELYGETKWRDELAPLLDIIDAFLSAQEVKP